MTDHKKTEDREQRYASSVRLAAVAALTMLTAAFLFVRMPEPRPYAPKGDIEPLSPWDPTELSELPPEPRVEKPPPRLPVSDPDGQETDPGVGRHDWDDLVGRPDDAPAVLDPVPYWKVEVKPRPVELVRPDYPELARRAGIEGKVTVAVLVDTLGRVSGTDMLVSSGNESLDDAAVDALLRSRFSPAVQQDRPVPVWVAVPVEFRLDD